jgi:hypothetical protein
MKNNLALISLLTCCFLQACSITMPVTVTNNPIGTKVGVATNNCINAAPISFEHAFGGFYPVSRGWCFNDKAYSLADAAQNGGISKIATVDLKSTNYLFFYKFELIVTGE